MTGSRSHEALVGGQFGARADAYLTSAVHAQGADLARLGALVAAQPGARVLDLGCGGGHVTFAAAPHAGEVVAYDLSPEMLAVVARSAADRGFANVATRQGRVEVLPFADASFDLVLSRFSAHHWGDLDAALAEARRVVKPGGAACFVDTLTPGRPLLDTWFQSLELLRDPSHNRNYTAVQWQEALARAGFRIAAPATHRLHLEFASWVARMATPPVLVAAIRALQAVAPDSVAAYFEMAADGSFTIDVGLFEAMPV
jgi:ubiquinone/menaquinone biosynthesis C-methylase UbiE